jgi:glycerate-2-kinase
MSEMAKYGRPLQTPAAIICSGETVVVGSDGPTNFAGGLVDSSTVKRAEAQGIDIYSSLKEHKISTVFQKLGDGIRTGATGTNVMDLSILIAE